MPDDKVVLLLTGDIVLGGEFAQFRDKKGLGWEHPFENVRPFFQEAHIKFGNLECTMFQNATPRNDYFVYSPPDSVSALRYLDYNVLCLGNNHITDSGDEGVSKTIEILDNKKIAYVGAGKNFGDVKQGVVIEQNGLKVIFFSYTFPEIYVNSVIAGPNKAGCALSELKRIKADIEKGRSISDIICISLHWGHQFYRYPSPKQIALAREIVDAGANVIIGHHPHVIQGYERYKHGVIFYSLGNFFFPDFRLVSGILYRHPKECNEFIIARCEITNGMVEDFELIPGFRNENFQLVVLDGKKREKAIVKIDRLCAGMKRDNYDRFWDACRKEAQAKAKNVKIKDNIRDVFERARELGIMGCIRKVSIARIKYIIKLLFRFWKSSNLRS